MLLCQIVTDEKMLPSDASIRPLLCAGAGVLACLKTILFLKIKTRLEPVPPPTIEATTKSKLLLYAAVKVLFT